MEYPLLPLELLDLILDHLHDDRTALLQCSLVKPLLPSARLHLFESTRIDLCTTSLRAFIDLLESPYSSLRSEEGYRSCIRTVLFDDLTKLSYQHGVSEVVQAVRNLSRVFGTSRPSHPNRTGLLSSTKSVCISNTDFERVPQEIISSLLICLSQTFTHLSLSSMHFYRFSEFVNLVTSFKALESITVNKITWTHNGRAPSSLPRAPQGVEWNILEVRRGGNLRDLADWISYGSGPVVKTLHYDVACTQEASFVRHLLSRTVQSIRWLQVSFPVFSDSVRVWEMLQDFISLDACTSLRSLHFKQILLFPGDAVTSMIRPLVPLLLNQLVSESCAASRFPRFDLGSASLGCNGNTEFRSLTFEMMLPTGGDEKCLNEFDWDGVVRALRGEDVPSTDTTPERASTISMLPTCNYLSSPSVSERVPPTPPSSPNPSSITDPVPSCYSSERCDAPAFSSVAPSASASASPFPFLKDITFAIHPGPSFNANEGIKLIMDKMRPSGFADFVSVRFPSREELGSVERLRQGSLS